MSAAAELNVDATAKIVFNRFHIMRHMGDAVDRVRKAKHRALRPAGDETLIGTKYLWLYGAERMPEKHRRSSSPGSRWS